MRRPLSLLPCLAVTAAVTVGVAPGAGAVEPGDDPLQVTIDSLSPGEVPDRGPVVLRGTVTNASDEPWRAVKVYAFLGDAPMTSVAELDDATDIASDVDVGDRILLPGTFDDLGTLQPGEAADYRVRLAQDDIPLETPGVYWFGAHALGTTVDDARDPVADGRARTFLPLMSGVDRPVRTSLLVQLRRPVRHTRTGRVLDVAGWGESLAPGGALHALTELGARAGSRHLTWLVDPAVPETVERLAAGNPPRTTVGVGPLDPASERPSDGPSAEGSDDPPGDATDGDPPDNPVAAPAQDWLQQLEEVLAGDRVLVLPYGDPDVSAATDHGPALLAQALERSGGTLERFGVSPPTAVAPPDGYLAPEAIEQLPRRTRVVVSDQVLPTSTEGSAFRVGGRRVLATSSGAVAGGPGPDDPLGTVAVRQRILAEAAVRGLADRPTPLVVDLPPGWVPRRPGAFFAGLDVDWVALTDAVALSGGERLDVGTLDYPPEERAAEMPAANFLAAADLLDSGTTLDHVLGRDQQLQGRTVVEALTSVSYANRRAADAVRTRTSSSVAWLQRRLSAVKVRALGVTLSGASGGIGTTISNRLDQPVTVSLKAITDASLQVDTPALIELAARSSQTVVLDARASRPGVHRVRLIVTDDTGGALGSSAEVPVRSAQVSEVIWVIIGVGVGLLFLAIAVRLVRRIRGEASGP